MSQLPDIPSGPYDLLVANAILVDGTTTPARPASVAIRDDTIVAIGDLPRDGAARVVDSAGLVLAPDFVDIHTHSDRTLLADPTADSKLRQGVTTEVIGNCGLSSAPCLGLVAEEERSHVGAWGIDVTWQTMGQYLDTLADGAFDMSFGGSYPPSSYAAPDELIEAAREVAAAGIYATHLRSAGLRMLESVQESIRIGLESGASVQISHHGAAGRASWGRVRESLPLIEAANREGLNAPSSRSPTPTPSTCVTLISTSSSTETSAPSAAPIACAATTSAS